MPERGDAYVYYRAEDVIGADVPEDYERSVLITSSLFAAAALALVLAGLFSALGHRREARATTGRRSRRRGPDGDEKRR